MVLSFFRDRKPKLGGIVNRNLEAIRQEHQEWLKQLESLAVQAMPSAVREATITSGEWEYFFFHLMDLTGWTRIDTSSEEI